MTYLPDTNLANYIIERRSAGPGQKLKALILVTHDTRIQKLQSLTISNGAALQIEDWVE